MKKVFGKLYFVICFVLILTVNASAYLDPSVMTYMIQVIAGISVAVGAVVVIYWRRSKRKVQDKLGIDENSKKEMEDEVIEIREDED